MSILGSIDVIWKLRKKWREETSTKPAKCSTACFEKTRNIRCSTCWGRLIVSLWKDGWPIRCHFIAKHLKAETLNLSDCSSWWVDWRRRSISSEIAVDQEMMTTFCSVAFVREYFVTLLLFPAGIPFANCAWRSKRRRNASTVASLLLSFRLRQTSSYKIYLRSHSAKNWKPLAFASKGTICTGRNGAFKQSKNTSKQRNWVSIQGGFSNFFFFFSWNALYSWWPGDLKSYKCVT